MPGTPDSTEAVGGSETLSIATISSTPDVGTVDELEGKWGCFKGGGGGGGEYQVHQTRLMLWGVQRPSP